MRERNDQIDVVNVVTLFGPLRLGLEEISYSLLLEGSLDANHVNYPENEPRR